MATPTYNARSHRFRPRGAGLFLLLATLAVFVAVMMTSASTAWANTITVTNTNNSGPGSLRAAINNAAPSGDTITFASNVTGTINSADLVISKNLIIQGPGAGKLTVSGHNYDTVFYIDYGKTVRISGLTITNGYADNLDGGGIYNEGNLTLTKSVVRGNFANGGGGIANDFDGNLTLNGSVVRDNSSDYDGGGIYNRGILTVQAFSTISGNTAGRKGGGIYSDTSNPARTTITNSTISGNTATSATSEGGGIYNGQGLTAINYSTIKNNAAPRGNGSGVAGYGQKGYVTTKVFSSIIAGNKYTDVDSLDYYNGNSFTSKGFNLIGDGNATRAFDAAGDRIGVTNPGRIIMGTKGNNTLRGTSLSDIISGLGGSDTISGLGGGDIIPGGEGNDTIYGGDGSDRLFGGPGLDKIYGGPLADFLSVWDSKPNDLAVGGTGTDTCRADSGDTRRSCDR